MSGTGLGQLLGGMSARDRRALGIVTAFLLVVVGYIQLIEPLVFRFDNALERRDRAEQVSTGYMQKIRMLPRREQRLAELEHDMSALQAYFAPDLAAQAAPIESLIDELTAYASISGTHMRQLVPDVETIPDLEGRIHDLELTGDYPALRRYLYLLETSPRRFNMMELEIRPPKDELSRTRLRFFDPTPMLKPASNVVGLEPLIIGVHGVAADLSVYVARAAGDFTATKVAVNLMPAGSPQLSASRLLSGEFDGVVGSLYDLMRYRLAGTPMRVLMPLGHIPLSASLVTKAGSSIDGLAGLVNKTLAVESYGMAEVLLLQLLNITGMTRSDLDIVYLDRRAMVRHLKSGLIDAALVSGLDETGLSYLGLRRVDHLNAGEDDWQSYLIVHADSLSRSPQRWQAVVQALLAAAARLEAQDASAMELAHEWLRYRNSGATVATLAQAHYADLANIAEVLGSDAAFGLDSLQELLLELGEQVPDTSRDELVDSAWLQALLETGGEG